MKYQPLAFLTNWLDPSDLKWHQEVSQFIAQPPPPPNDNFRSAYVRNNLVYQDQANMLKLRLSSEMLDRRRALLAEEARIRDELRDEKIKTAEERTAALYGNSRYADMKTANDELQLTIDRMVTLEWILRTAVK